MSKKRSFLKPHGFFLGFVSALSLAFVCGAAWLMIDTMKKMNERSIDQRHEQVQTVLAREEAEITLLRTYVCGVEEEEMIAGTTSSSEQILNDYKDWELVSKEGRRYIFRKFVHDLAPVCKENGYFGLTDDGALTLFDGPPHEQKVIQTFFQINTEKLQSGLFQRDFDLLKEGIRIHDLSEYHSILSTYGEYAEEHSSLDEEEAAPDHWS